MSVIIRLQNLAWSANASDIREFFKGLNIPEGGVHIVGGEMGDAFIAFSTDEDARLGNMKSGGVLKGVQVTLSLSSRTQMQKVIETARQLVMGSSYGPPAPTLAAPVQQPVAAPVQQPLPFHQPNPTAALEPDSAMQSLPVNQARIQQENKPDGSIYRPESNPVQNLSQQPFQGQVPQYTPIFPGAEGMKLPVSSGESNQVRPRVGAQPINDMQGQYHLPPTGELADNSKSSVEKKEKVQGAISDIEKSGNDKREKRNDRKDRESRDDRRRRSKSRSRSRERRRRYRSRSRDRSSRYRRSRSRDRDRGKDKDRRERDKRTFREQPREKRSQESSDGKPHQPTKGDIPGLGDIPAEIPKDKINIITDSPTEPITRTPHTRWGSTDFNNAKEQDSRQTIDMEIEPVDMDIEKNHQERHQSPQMHSTSFMRKVNPNIRQPPQDRQPILHGREPYMKEYHPTQELEPHPPNSRQGRLEPPHINPNGNFEGPTFSNTIPEESYRNVGPNDGHFHPDRRTFSSSFDDSNLRNGSGADGSYQGRGEWSQGNMQSTYSQRKDSFWNNNKYDPRSSQANFERPPMDKSSENDVRNNYDPMNEPQGHEDWSERSGQGRFSGREFPRPLTEPHQRSSFDRGGMGGRGGIVSDSIRGGSFYDQRSSEYQEDGRNFRGRGRGLYHGRGMSYAMSENARDRKPRTSCIEILHVPFNASYKAIRDFFYGIIIPSGAIKVLPDEDGNRSTTALMRFGSTMDASEAFKRRSGYIGDSQVSINFIDDKLYESSVDFMQNGPAGKFSDQISEPSNCVKICGLPEACTDGDIAQIFAEFRIGNIVIERSDIDGKLTGSSYVAFNSVQDAEAALTKLQGVTLDGNYLEGKMCPESLIFKAMDGQCKNTGPVDKNIPATTEQSLSKTDPRQNKNSTVSQASEAVANRPGTDLLTDSVVIKQVPCDLPQSAIHDFFSDEGIVPEKIYFGKANSEKLCDVYVVFPQVENAPKAVLKTGQLLGPVKATIDLISKPTVMRILGLPFNPLELFKKSNKTGMAEITKRLPTRDSEASRQAHSRDTEENREARPRDSEVIRHPNRRPDRTPMDDRRFQQDMNMKNNGRQERGSVNEHLRDRSSYPISQQEPPNRVVPNSATIAPDRFGRPGCVVALGNVPYSAGTDDILKFFRGFSQISAECVIRRYDEFNRPTADARVAMPNNEEAMRAINTLHKQFIINRPIFVSLVK